MESFWIVAAYCLIVLAPCLIAVTNFSAETERWGGPQSKGLNPEA